jgi:hypothetical protein
VVSVEGGKIVVFYYLRASEIWPDKRGGLIRGVTFDGSGLIRGVTFDGSGQIRGVTFDGSGLIRGGDL